MGAIFGIVGEASAGDLAAMASSMAYRGEHSDFWSPARDVYLGEITRRPRLDRNHPNLAADLWVHIDLPVGECSDPSEIDRYSRSRISEMLTQRGEAALKEIHGLFALAFWNRKEKSLVLASDKANYRQVFYVSLPQRFAFSTDYKALLSLEDCPIEPDLEAIQFYVATSRSVSNGSNLRAIKCLRQGHYLVHSGKGLQLRRTWHPRMQPTARTCSEYASQLGALLLETVDHQLADCKRVAVTLSGGLDSGGLVGLIRTAKPDVEIATYTIGRDEQDPEIQGARLTSSFFSTDHHEIFFDPSSIVDDLPSVIWLMEQFSGGEETLLGYQIECHLAKHESVMVGGHGADMVFAGMPRHRLLAISDSIPIFKNPLAELFQQTQTGTLPSSILGKIASFMAYRGKSYEPPRILGAPGPAIIPSPTSLTDYLEETIGAVTSSQQHSAIHDRGGVRSSFPYLTDEILEFSLEIPTHLKTSSFSQKTILRRALRDFLPEKTRNRQKMIQKAKHDLSLTRVLERMADALIGRSDVLNRGVLDANYVERLRDLKQGQPYTGQRLYRLWAILCLEIWLRTFVDDRGRSPIAPL